MTPEGYIHYGYDGLTQKRKYKKFENYVNKQHDRYDKFAEKRNEKLSKKTSKALSKFWKDPNELTKAKAYQALVNEIENKAISDLQHYRIDSLTIDDYKAEKKLKSYKFADKNTLKREAIEAVNRGAKGKYGNAADIAKFNRRMTTQEYQDIKDYAREEARKAINGKYAESKKEETSENYKVDDLSTKEKIKTIKSIAKKML